MDVNLREADAVGKCLRYVGMVDMAKGKGSVELRRYPKSHAFAQLQVGGLGGGCVGVRRHCSIWCLTAYGTTLYVAPCCT